MQRLALILLAGVVLTTAIPKWVDCPNPQVTRAKVEHDRVVVNVSCGKEVREVTAGPESPRKTHPLGRGPGCQAAQRGRGCRD